MKTLKYILAVMTVVSQQTLMRAQEYKIPVQNTKEGKVILNGFRGDLTVEGYNGNDVIIVYPKGKSNQTPEKAKGLKPLYANGEDNTGLGVNVERSGNQVTITNIAPPDDDDNFTIRVPDNFSVKIGNAQRPSQFRFKSSFGNHKEQTDSLKKQMYELKEQMKTMSYSYHVFNGDSAVVKHLGIPESQFMFNSVGTFGHSFLLENVTIRNMKNEIEVNNINDIKLENVTGPVVVSTVSGDIDVKFSNLNREKPTSITSVSGDVDISMPANSPVDLSMRTVSGSVYSDFDFPAPDKSMRQIGGSNFRFKLNGGGVDFSIVTVSGNVYLRKGK